MNEAIIPAMAAAVGGTALGGTILIHEGRAESAMRASRVRLKITFPVSADVLYAKAALGAIAGTDPRLEYVFELDATNDGVRYYLLVPAVARASVVSMLQGALPGLRVADAPEPTGRATLAASVFVPTPLVLSTDNPQAAARTLVSGVAGLASGDRAIVRWTIRPGSPRPFAPRDRMDRATREIDRAWRHKIASGPGFRASGLVVVQAASTSRARELREHLTSSLRSRRGQVGALRVTTERGSRSLASLPKTTRSSGWITTSEALGLFAWPLGGAIPGVEVGASRQLVVPRHVPNTGLHLLVGRDSAGNERPVALSRDAARLHLALFGSTGSGKTTVLSWIILDALARGIGGVFIDPKDAIETLIDHVPAEQADKLSVLDLSAPGPVPGLDLFGGDPVMTSDVILSVLKGVTEGWGPRIERYLRLSLRSLSTLPNPVLYDALRLLTEPGLRRTVIGRTTDPVIAAEWRAFDEGLSTSEQAVHVAPAIARITEVLSRPALRAVLSQPNPKLNIERHLNEGRWLLVALSPGTLGEPAANLLGGVVTYLVWAAVEKRAAIPPEQRHQVMLVLDELQSLTNLPVGIETFFERTRSLNCAVVASSQAASRLSDTTRRSLFANVGSLLTFRGGSKEAERLAPELPPLTAADIAGLARYEIAGRVNTGSLGSGSAVVTGHTEPLPPVTGMSAHIRELSAERYGRDPREIEQELRRRGRGDSDENAGYGRTGRAA
ncbi:MAG TPA: hypothetical protein VIH71_08075 [Solirubrobacteraceae bacterium]